MRVERLLAAGASIKGTARKFDIDYHALRRHWMNLFVGALYAV
jgi:hypothetical protein